MNEHAVTVANDASTSLRPWNTPQVILTELKESTAKQYNPLEYTSGFGGLTEGPS